MRRHIAALVAVGLVLAPAAAEAAQKESKAVTRLRAMTPEQFQAAVTIKDDALETAVTMTTVNGFQEKQGLLGLVPFDVFIRAFIDKRTGAAKFQIYMTSFYYGSSWVFWNAVNYATASGPQTASLDIISRDVGSCSKWLGCARTEVVAFDVDEALLRANAAAYAPGAITPWMFKIKGKSGAERLEGLSAAEIAGLLLAVDGYRQTHDFAAAR